MVRPVTTARKIRGRETERWLATYYQSRGWPDATAVAASISGRDIHNMLGLAPEVKARAGFDPLSALRQARKNANGDLAYTVMRMNGQGRESIGEFIVCMFLDDHTELLREAGYGDPMLPGTENFPEKIAASPSDVSVIDTSTLHWPTFMGPS